MVSFLEGNMTRNQLLKNVRGTLIDAARRGTTIDYDDLMRMHEIPRGHADHLSGVGNVVGDISALESEHGRPLLSVIVVRKDSRTKKDPYGFPGGGFFGLEAVPKSLLRSGVFEKPLSAEEKYFAKQEQQRVWHYWRDF